MYGKIKVGVGTPNVKELDILAFLQLQHSEGKKINVLELPGNSVFCILQNDDSTGREKEVQFWLTKQSLALLTYAIMQFFEMRGDSFEKIIEKLADKGKFEIKYSDNLKPTQIMTDSNQ